MADSSTPSQGTGSSLTIPDEVKAKYPELIALILGSESMNDEERQYWINILPVMTVEQIENLRQILQNEKDQLSAIDAKYSTEMQQLHAGKPVEEIAQARRAKRRERGAEEEDTRAREK